MYRGKSVSVVLPTYNEKDSIREVIENFEQLGVCDEIIVVNNNAAKGTSEEVAPTSAREVFEPVQGYGASVMCGLREAKCDIIVLCEPDATFVERDIFKLLEFSNDFDIVYGSRTMNDLIWKGANMGWFLRFGNWAVAKLMEVLFCSTSLSDVGCTYRLAHRKPLDDILTNCRVTDNYFSPEMMLTSILLRKRIVQIPLNYKDRVGVSAATGSRIKAFKIGMQMIALILIRRIETWLGIRLPSAVVTPATTGDSPKDSSGNS